MRKLAIAAATAAALGFTSAAQATWTSSFSDVVNGVSGTLSDTGFSGGAEHYTLVLNFAGAGNAIGDYMTAVDIKAFSSYTAFNFSASAGDGTWTNPAGTGGISSGGASGVDGCNTGNGGFACMNSSPTFQADLIIAANSSYTFMFDVFGATGLNTTGIGAHVGAGFTQFDQTGNAGILSQNTVAAIPEPETYAMLLAGLGLMGFVARRRQRNLAA